MKLLPSVVLFALAGSSAAFVAPSQSQRVSSLASATVPEPVIKLPAIPEVKDVSYGEESRKYRRTVYSHDDWVKHRSPDRFFRNLYTSFSSGVYRGVGAEVLTTTAIATFVVVYNALVGGFTDFAGVQQGPLIQGLMMVGLPLDPFTLSSPSLGLLLTFRANNAYKRWDEARKNWGYVVFRSYI